ncbi:MAG: AIR synthase related protein [Bacteroidales bacterium]|nr:AIR synthase related protein [Bacteroidales bacterium]MDD4670943.1 AIR synthase related protein [Bacteroidales bacterium]
MRTQLSDVGKIKAIAKLFENTEYINEKTILLSEKGECCTCSKILLEGVDFDLVYNPLKHLGYKAALYAIGDIYAKFYSPLSLYVNLGLSSRFCYEDVEEFWKGILAAAKEHSIKHLSLDLNPSVNGMCISISACGVQSKGVLEKLPGSKSMDLLCLSDNIGAAYMGLHVLEREKVAFDNNDKHQPDLSKYKYILESYLSPQIRANTLERFIEAGIYPSKGYFITKGLGASVLQLTIDTGLGAKVYIDKIPISSETFAMAQEIDMDVITAAMNGGDDYKFMFTIPIEKHEKFRKDFQDYDIIGHLAKPEVGAALVTPEGNELTIKAQGY